MLEKSPGAATCGHCHGLGADTLCPYCRHQVHRACLDSERCPVPHPWERRLGTGWRLREIDEEGVIARVGHVLKTLLGEEVRELESGAAVGSWPAMEHRGLPVAYLEPMAVGTGFLVHRAATYTVEDRGGDNQVKVYHHPLLAHARLSGVQLEQLELLPRPADEVDPERLLLDRDGRTAVLAGASRFDILDIRGVRPARVVDLRGEMIIDLAVSSEMGLAVAAMFDRLGFFELESGQSRGSIRLGEELATVALAGGRVAVVTAEGELGVYEAAAGPPVSWPRLMWSDMGLRGLLAPGQLALSHDGRLVALRHRRKQVVVIDLASDERQVLGGHTDTVCFVRFIAGGRVLVTADDDNRVRFWPRVGERIVSGD
jgi:hypothetical protein